MLELLADGSITTNRDFSTINVARSNSELRRQPPARGRAARTGAVKVQFTINRETHDMLRRVQDLPRHSVADGDPAVVFERALSLLLADLERKKFAQTNHPQRPRPHQTGSRHVPAAVRREVWTRDDGRCAFVGASGRCAERGFLEFHHVRPFAEGAETTAANLELRCRAHNAYEATLHFGTLFVREKPPTLFRQSWRSRTMVRSRPRAPRAFALGKTVTTG